MDVVDLTPEEMDSRIVRAERWMIRAAAALLTLWNEETKQFDRDIAVRHKSRKAEKDIPARGRVSTALAIGALVDYLRVMDGSPEIAPDSSDIAEILGGDFPLEEDPKEWPTRGRIREVLCDAAETMEMNVNHRPYYKYGSLQHLLGVTTSALYLHKMATSHRKDCPALNTDWESSARLSFSRLKQELEREEHGGPGNLLARHGGDPRDPVNYYVTFSAVRAHDLFKLHNQKGTNRIWDQLGVAVKRELQAQIGDRLGHLGARSNIGEMVFAAALLDRLEEENARAVVDRAAEIAVEVQREDGSWISPPMISMSEHVLQLSSYDIAYGLSILLLNRLGRGRWHIADLLLGALNRAFDLVQTSKVTIRSEVEDEPAYVGWASDASAPLTVIATHQTARVLAFLVRYRDALILARQRLVLQRYTVDWRPPRRQRLWRDFGSLGELTYVPAGAALRAFRDPTDDESILRDIKEGVLAPAASNPYRRPARNGTSFILYGPPGTGKTSLVSYLAQDLQWDLVVLTPADFLSEGGLGSIHHAAQSVFKDLLRLRRVVVLFDECEELFKRREPQQKGVPRAEAHAANRTEGAFLTAAMLPGLQRLHDRHWVIFVLATNTTSLEELDPAVTRHGRFDFKLPVEHPSKAARDRFLKHAVLAHMRPDSLTEPAGPTAQLDADERTLYSAIREAFSGSDGNIPWFVIDRVVDAALRKTPVPRRPLDDLLAARVEEEASAALAKELADKES